MELVRAGSATAHRDFLAYLGDEPMATLRFTPGRWLSNDYGRLAH